MEIRSGLEGLKSLLGVNAAAPPATQGKSAAVSQGGAFSTDSATLSSAASEVAQTAGDDGVRTDKVASIQAALASGTYSVPASAVASSVVDAMLGAQ
jgi:negative regulator of flagellin synthesis FlgM